MPSVIPHAVTSVEFSEFIIGNGLIVMVTVDAELSQPEKVSET